MRRVEEIYVAENVGMMITLQMVLSLVALECVRSCPEIRMLTNMTNLRVPYRMAVSLLFMRLQSCVHAYWLRGDRA